VIVRGLGAGTFVAFALRHSDPTEPRPLLLSARRKR
jgi:hypothetical protein